jgi:hypothetical protein
VGSTAYGLAGPDSDIDTMGVFATPTRDLLRLKVPADTVVIHQPDSTYHEAKKFVTLALKCNPAILELLWLPERFYTLLTDEADDLIDIRQSFPSERLVRNAYLGYATEQLARLRRPADGSFASDLRKRTAKHARHIARLAHQGYGLYTTGQLVVELSDPAFYHQFGEDVAKDPTVAEEFIARIEADFDAAKSPLPEHPDVDEVEDWLAAVRVNHYRH